MSLSISTAAPDSDDARALLDALSDTLAAITGDSGRSSFDPADVRGPGARFVIARDASGEAVGCGAYRPLQPGVAELKRMFARTRGGGIGRSLLAELEHSAAADGFRELWLETRRVNLTAVAFYRAHGYREIPNYGRYIGRPEAICFGKTLASMEAAA
ncbi:GNAT family N-acetyltransferase [Niveibacterium umoris]|uniref:GNAT superfamily N-acetyltransferase n=1 Tax=Niveibacterium umoris TaxID=1193620 RepID=A0A840BN58_9RHOO|nr:GNAT family N-acetyltransferase [Niveibacterium umoris]MBB4014073.1 GNAT superfamily N-acetyltransferase [Niveibacterium umoris]